MRDGKQGRKIIQNVTLDTSYPNYAKTNFGLNPLIDVPFMIMTKLLRLTLLNFDLCYTSSWLLLSQVYVRLNTRLLAQEKKSLNSLTVCVYKKLNKNLMLLIVTKML